VAADVLIHGQQPVAVPLHLEVRHPPHQSAQGPHHRADVEELHAQPRRAQLGHCQAGQLGCGGPALVMSALVLTSGP